MDCGTIGIRVMFEVTLPGLTTVAMRAGGAANTEGVGAGADGTGAGTN